MYSGTKKEHGGYIFGRPDGSYYFSEDTLALATATECSFPTNAANYTNWRKSPADTLVALAHTHPSVAGDLVYGCPDQTKNGRTMRYKRWPGDSGRQDQKIGDQHAAGGGSGNDWTIGQGLVDGYVLNADGEVWRLPKAGYDNLSVRSSNTDFHMFKFNSDQSCNW